MSLRKSYLFDDVTYNDEFNNFYRKYINKFVRIVYNIESYKLYYIDSIYYKNREIIIYSDLFDDINLLSFDWNIKHKVVLLPDDILYGKSDIKIEIISNEEYMDHINNWINQVKLEMTKFEPD